jgi:hypothetical protein
MKRNVGVLRIEKKSSRRGLQWNGNSTLTSCHSVAHLGLMSQGAWATVVAVLRSAGDPGKVSRATRAETEVEQDGKRFMLRSAPRPAASPALRAVGVALPPTVRQVVEI